MMHHTNTLRRFCVALCVGGKDKYWQTYEFVKERQQQELYHFHNIFFFISYSNILWNHGTEICLAFVIMCYSMYLIYGSLLHWGQFCIKIYFPLQMYFPFPLSGKILLYIILNFSTYASLVPINCQVVFPYWITNIYSLMPITVMVFLCVNPTATVCVSLCLLRCSPHWALNVVCDVTIYHVGIGLIVNALWELLWNQGQ
jgi:hypothetical protein